MHHLRHFSGGLVQTFNENFIVNTKKHAYTRCRDAITVTWKMHHLRHFSGGLVQTFNENFIVNAKNHVYTRCRDAIE